MWCKEMIGGTNYTRTPANCYKIHKSCWTELWFIQINFESDMKGPKRFSHLFIAFDWLALVSRCVFWIGFFLLFKLCQTFFVLRLFIWWTYLDIDLAFSWQFIKRFKWLWYCQNKLVNRKNCVSNMRQASHNESKSEVTVQNIVCFYSFCICQLENCNQNRN